MSKRGKRYNKAVTVIDEDKLYSPQEAVTLVKGNATAKFDETVELHIRTGADPRHADQMIRGIALLPHGVGKEMRTLVFCQGEAMTAAKEAGADHGGNDDIIEEIEKGWLEFDVSINCSICFASSAVNKGSDFFLDNEKLIFSSFAKKCASTVALKGVDAIKIAAKLL